MKHHHQQQQQPQRPSRHDTVRRFYCCIVLYGCLLFSLPYGRMVEGKVDRNTPHGHRGKLQPYPPGPFVGLTLTSDDETTLERGDSVMKQTLPADGSDSSGGAAICIQDVHAPMTAVWAQILHMEEYPKKVSKVLKCENYHVQEEDAAAVATAAATPKKEHKILRIKTKQVLGVLPGYSVRIPHDS
jgi:hypothetical protein